MDHKPVPHYRVRQLWLLGMLYLMTDPIHGGTGSQEKGHVRRLKVYRVNEPPYVTSCQNGVYLPGVDVFHFSQEVQITVQHVQIMASIFLGEESNKTEYQFCALSIGQYFCLGPEKHEGCYCQFVSSDGQNKQTFLITVNMPLSIEMVNQNLYLWYKLYNSKADNATLLLRRLPPMIGDKPQVSMVVNSIFHNVQNKECPKFAWKGSSVELKLCLRNLQNPLLLLFFDGMHELELSTACGNKSIAWKEADVGKKITFVYLDKCRRYETLICDYPAVAGASSVQMTKGLLGLLTLGYLLTYNT